MHRKLQVSDYNALLERLRGKFNSWSSRSLSMPDAYNCHMMRTSSLQQHGNISSQFDD